MNIQLAAICFLLGTGIVYMFISLIGIARFHDFFMRLHAQGVGDTLGAFLILAGMMVAAGANLLSVKLLLIFVIIVLTNPLGTNLMMIAAVNKEDYQGYRTLLSGEAPTGVENEEDEADDSDAREHELSVKEDFATVEKRQEQKDHTELHEPGRDTNGAPAKSNTKKKKSRRKRKPSMSMNRSELVAVAEKRGITVPEGATKREILSLIYPDKEL